MTAIKIVHGLLPSSFHREAPRTKRRKTKSFPCGMDVEHQHVRNNNNECLSNAPSLLTSRGLADRGIPDRLDPFSMDYLMDFDYNDGSRHSDIPTNVLMAIQYGNADQLTHHYHHNKGRLEAQRNSSGETLLHLACRWGAVAVIKKLIHDFKISAFVLDKQGRSPLHSLCLAANSSSVDGFTNRQNCNHLESMRLLLRESPSLILFKDRHGKVPLEYIVQNTTITSNVPVWKKVNEILASENIVNRVAEQMLQEMERSRSGQRMTMWEKINNMIDLSGLDAAIMETGLSV